MPANLQAECPHCKQENDYVFHYGLPKKDTELTCGKCQKKFPLVVKKNETQQKENTGN